MEISISPLHGYFLNGSKTYILAKSHRAAKEIFKGTGIVISKEGECYAVGTSSFVRQYVEIKVHEMLDE